MSDTVVEYGAVGPAAPLLSPHFNDVQAVKDEIKRAAIEGRDPDFDEFSDIALGAAGVTRKSGIITPETYVKPGLVNEAAASAYEDPVVPAEVNTPPAAAKGTVKRTPAKRTPAKKAAAKKAAAKKAAAKKAGK